jgi:hypothetical protein
MMIKRKRIKRVLTLAVMAMAILITAGSANAALSDGLVENWAFDGNYDAEVNVTHVGTLTTTGTGSGTFVSGKFGQGIDLENSSGNQAYIVIGGDENDFDFAGQSMSVSLWYTTESLYTSWQCLAAKGEGSGWRLHRYSGNATNINFHTSINVTGDGELDQQDGSWHHVVATADTVNGGKLYVDGSEVASTPGPIAITDRANAMQIGGNPDAGGRGWDGILDDVGIWNRALTADEVASLWNNGAGTSISGGATDPSPDIGGFVHPGNVDLGWTNADPNAPATSVYVDVWFGKAGSLTKVVDAEENATSKTVDASDPNTYYWRVDSYVNGSATGDPIEGPLWWFIAKDDMPPVVDAGVDMITWQDEPVQLDPTVVDEGKSPLTYYWTAPSEPDVVVVFSDPNTLAPTVTIGITKPFFVPFVGNGGFEDPVLADGAEWEWDTSVWVEADYSLWEYRWFYVDDDYTSTYNPTIAADGFEAPEGENVAIIYTYPGYDYALTQILAETLQASTRYDLSVQVGNSGPYNEGVSLDYRVELWTGGNVGDRSFLYGSGEQTIDPNGWETVNLTYACGPNHEQLGEPLEIRLIAESYADGHAVYFDDVILTIDGKSGTFPPHHSVDLTLAVNDEDNPTPVEDTMTIDVYADKCMAAIGAGAGDPGDIDVDCMTNLKDIAEIAAAWLDVYSVTAPFEKP